MLEIKNITKKFKGLTAVNNLSFKVNEGEVFGLLGSNGAGKTTTIKVILGLIKKYEGEVKIDKKQLIGYSPETPYFHSFLSAYEVMSFLGKVQNIQGERLNQEIEKNLKKVGLYKHRDRKIKGFSKGMVQRLAMAQALLGNPKILILDEPAAGMDSLGRIEMLDMINEIKEEGRSIILNSHILGDVERVADRGIILKEGVKIKEWTREEAEGSLEKIFVEAMGGKSWGQ